MESSRQSARPYSYRSQDPGRGARMGGRSGPTGFRPVVGQREGVSGNPQDLRDREVEWSKDPRETRSFATRRA